MKDEKNISPETAPEKAKQKEAQPKRARAFYETQDETSIYEEYLFGNGTYAKGVSTQAWSDTTKGRMGIRMLSRGLFGAAAFTWGGHLASKHMLNYDPNTFLKSQDKKGLQYLAYGFDMTAGKAISGFARVIAKPHLKDQWGKNAVRFRSKGYYHSEKGLDAGRSLGAEMVAMTFDFASASVGDATARNVIQAFDPSLQKPWENEDGKFDHSRLSRSILNSSWRVFSKNQMEDWAAALPYVYQMKWQRQALSRMWPGFKLVSDNAWNGGSMKMNAQGNVTGDYSMPGAIDLQFRFMGYNWYTLMYRETYDAVKRNFEKWKDSDFQLVPTMPENPLEAAAKTVISPIRYAAKSFVKAHIYMLPAVPFFWMWRTPQSKWKSGAILENAPADQNAIASITPRPYDTLSPAQEMIIDPDTGKLVKGEITFRAATAAGAGREGIGKDKAVAQGGKHTNPGLQKTIYFGEQVVENKAGIGVGDSAYKWKNQKSIFSKILYPFGMISYKLGSLGVHGMDKFDPNNKLFKFLGSDKLRREVNFRNFTDASLAYTPYFIAKTELGLRVDDRGPGGTEGRMDKAIYGAIDNLATFNINGFQKSIGRMINLVSNPAEEVPMKEGEKKEKDADTKDKTSAPPTKPATKIQSATTQLGVEARRNFKTKPENAPNSWADGVKKTRDQQASLLYPPHNTVQ